ncbi:MAG: acyl-CoA thioesterase [Bradyrhizobiaceae bacterium]|nr:acyl-CoA thioesterase [Bradyrhizobiaceae bacterium]
MKSVVHHTHVRVRYADTDKMGIVYNGTYLQYFEIGRTELLRGIGLPYTELEAAGILLPVLEAHVVYQRPARYDDVLDIEAQYSPEASASIRITYTIRCNDVVLATGFTRHSFVSATTWRPMRPPTLFTNAIETALQDIK